MNRNDIEQGFFELYESESDALFRFVFFRVNEREAAQDIVQESFTKLWESLNGKTHIENPRAFLFRIASNKVIDRYRKKEEYSLDLLAESGFDAPSETSIAPDAALDLKQATVALKRLSPIAQEVLLLRYVEDWSVKDIAEHLGVSSNVASVRIHRGLAEWRQAVHRISSVTPKQRRII